ncbi:hypothetical protein [Nonomuraea typhae]|uniref:hypothetical protein n=1 Tax=Nonomuraea typhae TaxID=2603600 RepID=UPI0012FB868C|nr:hypothetical protein [Nonomuraea typhae]
MLSLYFGGSEVPGWRTLLAAQGVEHVALSFVGLLRRTKLTRPWLISAKYPDHQSVFVDSGGYTLNAKPQEWPAERVEDLVGAYRTFIEANLDRIAMVSELDATSMGPDWLARHRSDFYDHLGEKFLPIWHAEHGVAELERLADRYGRVGVPQISVAGRDIAGLLNRLARRGVRIHGVAMTKTDLMEQIGFDSVASTSWLSPAQYGDTQIWTGHALKRYPRKYKDQGRKRHRQHLERAGFDIELIESDNASEVLKVAIWSWRRFVDHINTRKRKVVDMSPETPSGPNAEVEPDPVDTPAPQTRKPVPTPRTGERALLPGLTLAQVSETGIGDDGQPTTTTRSLVELQADSLRQCDTCYLASHCPANSPGSACAYTIPVTIKTRDQLRAVEDAVVSMQFQRVAFLRLVEESEGGYADPNLSAEIDRLHRMLAKRAEADAEGFSLTVKASGRAMAEGGTIARLFGSDASHRARELEAPRRSDDVLASLDVVEAEVIDR